MNNDKRIYELSVKVLLPLDHDRYKSYFTQFTILHLGLFTAMNSTKLGDFTLLFAGVGVVISVVWLHVLMKINSDINEFWKSIEAYEKDCKDTSLKLTELRSKSYPSGQWMLSIPVLLGIVHAFIFLWGV